jgi:hypothetical protein
VTTIGRENCDISINVRDIRLVLPEERERSVLSSPHVDHQHALIEYDDEQRTFILKDLNSTSVKSVHECRVQNSAVRLADGGFVRFGFNGLPLEFRVEQHEVTIQRRSSIVSFFSQMGIPSIYSPATTNNARHVISHDTVVGLFEASVVAEDRCLSLSLCLVESPW